MNHTDAPAAKAAMLIRRPVADVFEVSSIPPSRPGSGSAEAAAG